ncbi:MAG: TRAP transporter substrate-binding protein DctP [Myxococcales bacterium]|nr:TRAP transporter substrate-binding protein DctP [Myxococcales bacterium]MCB9524061.1 TRAP transporter substrate-binding protein DctP [Myxococcales bacterium]
MTRSRKGLFMLRRTPLTLTALLALLALLAPGVAAARKVTVKLATLAPKGTAYHDILSEMAAEWKDLSDGQVQVKIFPGGVAGDDVNVVRKMRLGTVSGGLLTSAGVATIHKAIHGVILPMGYKSRAELDYVFDKMRPTLEAAYAQEGFVVLNWVSVGFVRFFTKEKAATPEELQKMKLFTWAGREEALAMWKAAGFNPVPLPSTEISTGLQTGLIDALPTTPQAANLMNWYTHVGYMIDEPWAPLVGGTVISKEVWEQIDPALRAKLAESARKAGEKLNAASRPANQNAIDAMTKRGLQLVKLTAEQRADWAKRVEAAYPMFRETYAPGPYFDEALKHRDAFRKLGGFTDGAAE